ncbi:poly-gamma-glutamate hydrolase family protein [Streptomyces camelliae]|uniref:Poly-gamma-glutamate hydrolase family protein n=1 Tax=Streptomyces camelliae TaxID=3004093 RepID=A0ABY7PL21_9ACTN|nr:poly-gamma-glutamate hydrolase family protein [Streptomyces sp. HUAS 2-6]WBO69738.1 poly-gamma-glutamate hydrolase family protein [Streptomyces sp. HUAS 2-6]
MPRSYPPEFRRKINARGTSSPVGSTAVIAPHGGGIEAGTSELCMAIAGYTPFEADTDPASAAVPGEPQRDYWMFEALANSAAQHVTSAAGTNASSGTCWRPSRSTL